MKKSPFAPPTGFRPLLVDHAEFTALRVIVMALVAEKAIEKNILNSGTGQSWINDLSALCQESIIASDINVGGEEATSRFRAKVLEKINDILGSIGIPNKSPNPDANA